LGVADLFLPVPFNEVLAILHHFLNHRFVVIVAFLLFRFLFFERFLFDAVAVAAGHSNERLLVINLLANFRVDPGLHFARARDLKALARLLRGELAIHLAVGFAIERIFNRDTDGLVVRLQRTSDGTGSECAAAMPHRKALENMKAKESVRKKASCLKYLMSDGFRGAECAAQQISIDRVLYTAAIEAETGETIFLIGGDLAARAFSQKLNQGYG